MAISKTNFINYTRCKRFVALENIRKDKLSSKLTKEEYLKEKKEEKIKEIVDNLFDSNDNDITNIENQQLNEMLKYYTEVELITASLAKNLFKGNIYYGEKIDDQMYFECDINNIKYACFSDVVIENDDEINVIEVKSTTSKKYLECKYNNQPVLTKKDNFYYFNNDNSQEYKKVLNKFMDRYSLGKYFYDIAFQRYVIENNKKYNKKVNYYLAVLNHEYVYDGYKENGKRVYRKDKNSNDIIIFIDVNDITKKMYSIVDNDRINLEKYIEENNESKCNLGKYCMIKTNSECKYKEFCFKDVPKENASYNYMHFINFKDENGKIYDKYELINNGYLKLSDIPISWINNDNKLIQRDCFDNNKIYYNKEKIQAGLNTLKYPIYHLDFETFPCPLPRFYGEKCYTQSVFEFSVHIEREPGICDYEEDSFVYMSDTFEDDRENMVKKLVDVIDLSKGGCFLAQNVSFEKARIKELAEIFPQYKDKLMNIYNSATDLLYIINNNKELYLKLGFSEKEASTVNYYNSLQSGSYSIKKTLPLFSNLSYKNLDVKNGTEASTMYSKFEYMTKEKIEDARCKLIKYCKQDTWAMVEILNGLRKLVNK